MAPRRYWATRVLRERRRDSTALKMALRIVRKWGLSDAQSGRMLGMDAATVRRHRVRLRSGRLPEPLQQDVLYRVGHTFAIWRALAMLFSGHEHFWLTAANRSRALRGRSPLKLMTSGRKADLVRVRLYLEGALQQ